MHTIPSPRIGRVSEEYSLVAFVSRQGSEKLIPLLGSLEGAFPSSIYSLRLGQLHITITAVMRDITYGENTREEFLKQETSITDGISEVVKSYSPFAIHFNEAVATQDAVIIKSPNTETINKLRSDIIRKLSIPYPPGTFAHSSIARFKSEIPIEAVGDALTNQDIDFTEHISELCLVRETVMPLEKYEIVATFRLS